MIETPLYPPVFEAGEHVQLNIVLIGQARQDFALFFSALTWVGMAGVTAERVRLRLCEVQQEKPTRDNGGWVTLWDGVNPPLNPFDTPSPEPPAVPEHIRMELLSPLRLKRHGKRVTPGQFELSDPLLIPQYQHLTDALAHHGEILSRCADHFTRGKLKLHLHRTVPLARAAEAHRLIEDGHVQGKIVLLVANGGAVSC